MCMCNNFCHERLLTQLVGRSQARTRDTWGNKSPYCALQPVSRPASSPFGLICDRKGANPLSSGCVSARAAIFIRRADGRGLVVVVGVVWGGEGLARQAPLTVGVYLRTAQTQHFQCAPPVRARVCVCEL